jgi:hypothetical protein
MNLTKPTVETLIDLVENKLSCMDVWDREDRRQALLLKRALQELTARSSGAAADGADLIAYGGATAGRRGRRPRVRATA